RKQDKITHDTPSEQQQQPPPSSQDRNQDNNHDDISATQYQNKESQNRNPHMTGFGGSPASNPQMIEFDDNFARSPKMAGFNDNSARSPQEISMGNASDYEQQQQHDFVNAAPVPFTGGTVLPEKDSYQTTMSSPAFVMPPTQATPVPAMGYALSDSEYIPNAMNVPVHYAAPSSQAFYSKDDYGNVYKVTPVSTVSNSNAYPMPPMTTKPPANSGSTGYFW
ncbi:hypothetical protein BGX26_006119, partial [Mortierella sp. AD094]